MLTVFRTPQGLVLCGVFFILAVRPGAAHMADGAIALMDADGSNVRLIADGPGNITGLTWGTDDRMVFLSVPDTAGHNHPGAQLGIYDDQQSTIQFVQISSELRGIRSLAFSGNRVAFVAQPPGSKAVSQNDLYVIDIARQVTVNLTNGTTPYIGMPSWSPSGDRIAFTAGIGHEWSLHVWKTDGLAASPHDTFDFDADVNFVLNAAWSPDGSQFALQQIRDGNSKILVMKADGTDVRNITNHPAADQDPSWSPDGRELTFVSDREDGSPSVYRALADGSGVRRLTDAEGADLFPHWSPRGICFLSDRIIEKRTAP